MKKISKYNFHPKNPLSPPIDYIASLEKCASCNRGNDLQFSVWKKLSIWPLTSAIKPVWQWRCLTIESNPPIILVQGQSEFHRQSYVISETPALWRVPYTWCSKERNKLKVKFWDRVRKNKPIKKNQTLHVQKWKNSHFFHFLSFLF